MNTKNITGEISVNELVKQCVSDWFGKEVQTGYTLTYVWMANQFGHFNIGFLFTLLLMWTMRLFHVAEVFSLHHIFIPIAHLIIWTVKETYDYYKVISDNKESDVFRLNKPEVALNALTAVFFIGGGIVVAYLSFVSLDLAILYGFFFLLLSFFPSYHWLMQKMYFQQSGLPYQFRLNNFRHALDRVSVFQIGQLLQRKHIPQNQFVIFSNNKALSKHLAVGIGTEFSFRRGVVLYTSFINLLKALDSRNSKLIDVKGQMFWDWEHAELIIIDDVSLFVQDEQVISPSSFKEALRNLPQPYLELLGTKKIIWNIGTTKQLQNCPQKEWGQAIADVFHISERQFHIINMDVE